MAKYAALSRPSPEFESRREHSEENIESRKIYKAVELLISMPNANTDKIEIHLGKSYESRLKTLKQNQEIIPKNRDLIIEFLRDAEIGKTNPHKAKKKVGEKRLTKYISLLSRISGWFNKPFNEVTVKDMEMVVLNLEKGKYKKMKVTPVWKDGKVISMRDDSSKETYSKNSVLDFKKGIKKFFRWLLKNDLQKYNELTSWMETYEELTEVPALSREEIEKMANASDNKYKAIIMFLFDSGARIEEALNIRMSDISKKTLENTNTISYYVRIKHSKTKPRTIHIPMCLQSMDAWISIHPDKDNLNSPLFPITYNSVAKFLGEIGEKVLKKNVYPHLLRHSSATYYCNKLSQYQLCYRYGWSMSSRQPTRYIDREGIHEEDTVKKYTEDEVENLKRENKKLKEDMGNANEQLSKLVEFIPMLRTIESSRKIIGIINKEMKNPLIRSVKN